MTMVDAFLVGAAIPVSIACGYLALLAACSQRTPPPAAGAPRIRFDIIVPAHDEESGIAETVRSLLSIDYPRSLFRVIVLADNCVDQTIARAVAAGASVLVRQDAERRGKGYALDYAFRESLAAAADAVVVIDADTVASGNLLHAFASRLEAGAGAVQADYSVRNPNASWRTRLMTIALAMFHVLRSLARERLGVSCGLRGNGMCFTRAVLSQVPHQAFSIVEDLEYGLRLGEAGHRVHYAGDAHVFGEMVAGERAARSQRHRWEGGRWQIARLHGPRLLLAGLARRDAVILDLAMDLLVPPFSILTTVVVAGLGASIWISLRGRGELPLWVWGACALALLGYVMRGWQLSGTGLRGLAALSCSPAFLLWKATLLFRRNAPRKDEWIRTAREGSER